MSGWRTAAVATVAVTLAACGQVSSPVPSVAGGADLPVPRCEDVAPIAVPAEHLRDEPIYVANEQPIEELSAWASSQPGFEQLWIDRRHQGWVVLAFSEGAEDRQAELTEAFPEVGAVVVAVDWTLDELEEVQQRAFDDPRARELQLSSGIDVLHGVVTLEIGAMTDERLATLAGLIDDTGLDDERVCVSGIDPATLPAEGPQQEAGEGWRLLADEQGGEPYRTGIAADEEGYARLWDGIGLGGDPPTVDLETEVVLWFGAVYGSSCPDLRLDDVVVDHERKLVHAEIVDVSPAMDCTADANGHAYVVAVDRGLLPAGPFAIQLGSDDPPPGAPEERTLVDADLTQPGAALPADRIGADPSLTEEREHTVGPGDLIEPGYPAAFRFHLHCGPEWLGPLNDVLWRSDVTDTPAAWRQVMDDREEAVVEVLLETDPPTLTATANGHQVVYHPTAEDHPGCD